MGASTFSEKQHGLRSCSAQEKVAQIGPRQTDVAPCVSPRYTRKVGQLRRATVFVGENTRAKLRPWLALAPLFFTSACGWALGLDFDKFHPRAEETSAENGPMSDASSFAGRGPRLVAAYEARTCVTSRTGVQCWGGGEGASHAPAAVEGIVPPVRALSVGATHACAIGGDDVLVCWGLNAFGQLGNGTITPRTWDAAATEIEEGTRTARPVPVRDPGGRVAQVVTGEAYSCARLEGGEVRCWGDGELLGRESAKPATEPQRIPVIDDAVDLAGGPLHACARRRDASVWCWGRSASGQRGPLVDPLGLGAEPNRVFNDVRIVAPARNMTCAMFTSGAIDCVGERMLGGALPPQVPRAANAGPWTSLAASDDQLCALTPDGRLGCWFEDESTKPWRGMPSLPKPAVAFATGSSHVCAVSADGDTWCWGDNQFGQLGKPTSEVPSSRVPLSVERLDAP